MQNFNSRVRSQSHIKKNMKAVKSRDSRIEKRLGKALWNYGIKYRKNYMKLPGKPDFVIIKSKIAIFCDSHFWHGYNWDRRKLDHKSNIKFWHKKISRNIERDEEVNEILKKMGWQVIRFWEHEIKENMEKCVKTVKESIK